MENSLIKQIQNEDIEPDWEFLDLAVNVEKEWKELLLRFTDKELLEIFPEAKRIIPYKIEELEKEMHKL